MSLATETLTALHATTEGLDIHTQVQKHQGYKQDATSHIWDKIKELKAAYDKILTAHEQIHDKYPEGTHSDDFKPADKAQYDKLETERVKLRDQMQKLHDERKGIEKHMDNKFFANAKAKAKPYQAEGHDPKTGKKVG